MAAEDCEAMLITNPGDILLVQSGLRKEHEKAYKELFKFQQLQHCETPCLREMASCATRCGIRTRSPP
eukprot:SAG11_NODE_1537_length_4724_cov_4.318270_8_plen_68_part_00